MRVCVPAYLCENMGNGGLVIKVCRLRSLPLEPVFFYKNRTRNSCRRFPVAFFIMCDYRDRSEGWLHAKLSGHENEDAVAALVRESKETQDRILQAAGKAGLSIVSVEDGGLYESSVESVLEGKTKSKTDLYIGLSDGSHINISIKKSYGGQVYLIGTDHFIDGFQKQFGTTIPRDVKRAILLFWGDALDTEEIISAYASNSTKAYELRKHRLTADTLFAYKPELYKCLIHWFSENMKQIVEFCFSRGLAKDPQDWADLIWYINLVGEECEDEIFSIEDVKERISNGCVEYGNRGGGTTIQLPFGFVQWHQSKMQFHHNFDKLNNLYG